MTATRRCWAVIDRDAKPPPLTGCGRNLRHPLHKFINKLAVGEALHLPPAILERYEEETIRGLTYYNQGTHKRLRKYSVRKDGEKIIIYRVK